MIPVAILMLAAGASTRMRGEDKLLRRIGGEALLHRQTGRALATGHPVFVTLPYPQHPRCAEIGTAIPVFVPDAACGMAHSIRAGVAAVPDSHAVLLAPADMPDIQTGHFMLFINQFQSSAHPTLHRASNADGTPGHPVLFPPDCRDALLTLTGDDGARSVVKANEHRLRTIALPGDAAITDLDTPEAWTAYLAKQDTGR